VTEGKRFLGLGWSRMKKIELFVLILVFVANGLALASAVLLQSIWAVIICLGCNAFSIYSIYVRFVLRRRVRYPLVPPEGKPDMYVPRTDIPRPIIEDFRKIEEKKRRFAKIRKLVSKKVRKRKK